MARNKKAKSKEQPVPGLSAPALEKPMEFDPVKFWRQKGTPTMDNNEPLEKKN
ncbi:MAG: hypothetical protein ACOY9Y_12470 [Bacillota bacterium]